jgi:hypothetical protein
VDQAPNPVGSRAEQPHGSTALRPKQNVFRVRRIARFAHLARRAQGNLLNLRRTYTHEDNSALGDALSGLIV